MDGITSAGTGQCPRKISMSWTCPGHYKVHVHGRDSPGRPVHGHCPVPLPALGTSTATDNLDSPAIFDCFYQVRFFSPSNSITIILKGSF